MQKMNDKVIRDHLRCTGCTKFLGGKVGLCSCRKTICDTCYAINRFCRDTNCRTMTWLLKIEALDSLVKNLFVGCTNACCKETIQLLKVNAHESKCKYRNVTCKSFPESCLANQREVQWNEYTDHLIAYHSAKMHKIGPEGWSPVVMTMTHMFWKGAPNFQTRKAFPPKSGFVEIMHFDGITFFATIVKEEDEGFLYVSALLPSEEAHKHKVNVYLLKDGNAGYLGGYHAEQKIVVSGVRQGFEEVKGSNLCATYSLKNLVRCSVQLPGSGESKTSFQINFGIN